jgi:hypothetical protein
VSLVPLPSLSALTHNSVFALVLHLVVHEQSHSVSILVVVVALLVCALVHVEQGRRSRSRSPESLVVNSAESPVNSAPLP